MNARTMIAGAAVLAALAGVGAGAASAQPRDDKPSKARPTNDARIDDDDDGFGPEAGRGWAHGGRDARGPGRHGRGPGGPGGWGPGFGGMGMGWGRGGALLRGGGRIAEALGLSEAQRRKLRDIREDHHRAMIRARADMELARLDLSTMLEDDAPMAGVERQIDTLARMRADRMKSTIAAHRAALDVLTAKQRAQLKEMRDRRPGPDDGDATPRRRSRR